MDKYDDAIAFLTENPRMIYTAWNSPEAHRDAGGCLFMPCYRGRVDNLPQDAYPGCLTQIRSARSYVVGHTNAALAERLTKEIRDDVRIPNDPNKIRIGDLEVLAEWQRKLDKELVYE